MSLTGMLILVAAAAVAGEEKRDLSQLTLEQLMNVEVVYAASKQEQSPRFAPASITLVTAADIERFGYRNLGDILRAVRGFYVTNDRNYSYVGVRGFGRPGDYNTRILLLIDGHKVNDNIYESAMIGNEFPIDVEIIDRVEVVRGPSSSMYGTNAFFAVVNVITRRESSGEVSTEAASYGTYRGRAAGAHEADDGTTVFASASAMSSRGQQLFFREFDAPETNGGVTNGTDFERRRSAFASASRGGLRVEALYSMREKAVPTGSFGTVFNDRRNKTRDGSTWIDVAWQHDLAKNLNLQARAHGDHYWYDGDYAFDYPPVTLNSDRSRGTWWGSDVTLLSTQFAKQTLIGGLEYQENVRQDQQNFDRDPYTSYLDARHASSRWALYLQDEIRFSDRALLYAGVRRDEYEFGSHVSPRAALVVTPRHDTTFKAVYGEAFRAPNQYELHYATEVPVQLPNPELMPERIRTYEVVADRFFSKNFELQTSAFMYTIDDLISLTDVGDGAVQFQNADHIDARGAESELSWKSPNDVAVNLSYAWQRSTMSDGTRLTNSPVSLAKLRVGLPVFRYMTGGIETQYVSRRLTLSGAYTEAALLTNINVVARRLARHAAVAFSIYNAFNSHYSDPGSEEHPEDAIAQDGRSYRVNVTWRF